MKPIPDRAEVSLDFPEKAYMGAFGHAARFEAHARADQDRKSTRLNSSHRT